MPFPITTDNATCYATNLPQCGGSGGSIAHVIQLHFDTRGHLFVDQSGVPKLHFCERYGGVESITVQPYDYDEHEMKSNLTVTCLDGTRVKVTIK